MHAPTFEAVNHDVIHTVSFRSAQYTRLLRIVFYSLSNVLIDWCFMPSGDATTPLLKFMQKIKHDLQLANKEFNCLHDTELLYSFRS